MAELFNNLARSTLASGITAASTSLTVQAGDGTLLFPAITSPDLFRCVLFNKSTGDTEIIIVTARSSDVFTISRAQETIGNSAATAYAFNAGDIIELRPTKGFFDSLATGSSSTNVQSGTFIYGVDTGAADVYVVAMNPTAAAISDGQEVRVKIGGANTNTGIAATLKLDGLAAVSITTESGNNPPSGSIKAGYVHTFIYDGTEFVLQNAGIALTALGFNAEGKKIQNVAAGIAYTDAATIGGTENFRNKTLTSPVIATQTGVVTINGNNFYRRYPGLIDGTSGTAFKAGGVDLTVSNPSTGIYTITHNFGSSTYSIVGTSNALSGVNVSHGARYLNTVDLRTTDAAGSGVPVSEISFEIVRY